MSDSYIQVPPDSTGKKVDADQITVGADDVQRQRVQIGGAGATSIAPVSATDGLAVDVKTLAPDAATETTLAELAAQSLDYNTSGGTAAQVVFGLALPSASGPVAGGTSTNPLRTDPTGTTTQPVSVVAGVAVIGHVITDTGSATAVTGNVTVVQPTGSNLHVVTDSGTITTVSTVTAVTAITNALPAGTNAIGKLSANSGVDIGDVDVTSIAAGTNLIGDVGVQPRATNGLSVMNATSSDGATALTSTAQVIKASAGLLYGYYIYNPNAVASFVQFYNTAAASVTVGTTNPLFMLTIPASSAANLLNDIGITFSNAGWSWAATSSAGGTGAPSVALDAVAWFA